jgi:hypothetical protein
VGEPRPPDDRLDARHARHSPTGGQIPVLVHRLPVAAGCD